MMILGYAILAVPTGIVGAERRARHASLATQACLDAALKATTTTPGSATPGQP